MTVRAPAATGRRSTVAIGVAAAVVAVSVVWGHRVQADERVKLGAAPLVGAWKARLSWRLLFPLIVAAVIMWFGPRLVDRLRWRTMTVLTGMGAAGFTLLLAAADGWSNVLDPVVHPTEYWANLATLPTSGSMLRDYGTIDFLLNYSVHAKGHPPGFLLLLQGLDGIELGRPWVAGALSYLGAAALPVAVLVTVRAMTDHTVARRVAPFLVLAPYAVWMGTSADALYTATTAWGVACAVLAIHSTRIVGRVGLGATAGLLLSIGLFFTYGTAIFMLLPLALVLRRSRRSGRDVLVVAGSAALVAALVTGVFAVSGFWWFDGATTTKTFYWWGTAQFRPWRYFLIGNIGAALIAIGPAVVAGFGALRDRALWWVVGGAMMCILVADVSQYSKAEVERIWLLFFPWLVPAVASLKHPRRWLAVQAVLTVGLQATLVSKW
jgi:methylthioxylose transferase